jgi:hypothetical protein
MHACFLPLQPILHQPTSARPHPPHPIFFCWKTEIKKNDQQQQQQQQHKEQERNCKEIWIDFHYLPFLASQIKTKVPSLLTATPLENRKSLMSVVVSFVTGSYLMNLPVLSPSKVARKNCLQAKFVTSRKNPVSHSFSFFFILLDKRSSKNLAAEGRNYY